MTTTTNTQAPAATEAPPAAWLCTRPSGSAWPLMPEDMKKAGVREMLAADQVVVTPLYPAAPAVGASPEPILMWHDRIKAAHPTSKPEYWPVSLKAEYMEAEILELRAALAAVGASVQPVRASPAAPTAAQIQALALELFEQDVEDIEATLMRVFSAPHAVLASSTPTKGGAS